MQSGRVEYRDVRPALLTGPSQIVAGAFLRPGSDEQIFGANEQILGQDQSDQVVAVRPTNSVGSLLQRRRCAPSHLGGGR